MNRLSIPPVSEQPILAVEIGGSKLQLFLGTGDGTILERQRLHVRKDQGGEGIRAAIAAALPELLSKWQPKAIGIGYGGPVDWREGRVVKSYHIDGWTDFPLAEWLTNLSRLPVFVENDGNVAALGEAWLGAGRGCDPVFYVTNGSGVGGGLVSEGRIFHGITPGEAEIGHLVLDPDGTTPEDWCSGWSLNRRILREISAQPQCYLAELVAASAGNEARHLGPALEAGDELASRIVGEAAQRLALALSHVVHLFHPEIIVLGGGVSLIGEAWRGAVANHLRSYVMDAFQPGPSVALASLREDAVPVGALVMTAQRAFSQHQAQAAQDRQIVLMDLRTAQST
jgi:glucokinase